MALLIKVLLWFRPMDMNIDTGSINSGMPTCIIYSKTLFGKRYIIKEEFVQSIEIKEIV